MRQLAILLLVVLGTALPVSAQNEEQPPERPSADRMWVLGQIVVPGRYYYRGFVQERDGFIVQPAFRIGADLYEKEDAALSRVAGLVGFRASFHEEKTLADDNGNESWYEADLLAGVQFELFERLEADLLYASVTSPNGAFDTIEEINLNMTFDDAGLWPGSFAVQPLVNIKTEIGTSAFTAPRGTLLQLGMEPGFNPFESRTLPLRVSFPVEVGISLDNYYFLPEPLAGEDDTFGYAQVGASLTMPLFFISPDYGQWAMQVGVDYIYLGDNLKTFNQGRQDDWIPRLAILMRF